MTDPIRVAVVEDDRATHEGLGLLIGCTPGYRCIATFRSIEDASAWRGSEQPDVLLVDIDLPGMSGSDGVTVLKERYPGGQIVMLTVYAEQDKVFQAICNGACGYLLKETAPARLLEAIGEAFRGGAPMSPDIARKVVTAFQKNAPSPPSEEQLTPQEIHLLQLLSDGYSYEGASHHLNVSVNTVGNYIRSVYDKLHVHSKSEAVSKALRSQPRHFLSGRKNAYSCSVIRDGPLITSEAVEGVSWSNDRHVADRSCSRSWQRWSRMRRPRLASRRSPQQSGCWPTSLRILGLLIRA